MMVRIGWLAFLLLLFGGIGYYFLFDGKAAEEITTNDLPELRVEFTSGSMSSFRELDNVIIIFFNPQCDHCQNEATAIANERSVFDDYEVYFITSDSLENAGKFAREFRLEAKNFHFGHATPPAVFEAMGPVRSIPTMYVYKKRVLKKIFSGETSLEEIKTVL